jgi:nitrite reductase/ring-hydroxylating ferredoxin subunit
MSKVKLVQASEVSNDAVLKVAAEGKTLLVSKSGDRYCAIENKCPHLGLPLAKGKVSNGQITCPFHGSKFDLCSGQNVEGVNSVMGIPAPGWAKKAIAMGKPAANAASFTVSEEGGELFAEI